MIRPALMLLATTALLTACVGEEERREFLYKPAYCLAGGLAHMGSEACLPKALKDKAEAVATAKMKDAVAETPSEDLRVYYTEDQRLAMSYSIAQQLFKPSTKLARTSATMSLEASNLIDPTDTRCGVEKARKDAVDFVSGHMSDHRINRDTASFLAENYTDLQLTELYRVAKLEGSLSDVKDDAFIMPDPRHRGRSINVKPKSGTALGGILSFSTSRVASRVVDDHRAHIETILKERTLFHCPPKIIVPDAEESATPTPATDEPKE